MSTGKITVRANPIEHELAHRLADLACEAGDPELALELLERAERNGRRGSLSSIRTMNRVLNLRERADSDAWYCERCGALIDNASEGCTECCERCEFCNAPMTDTSGEVPCCSNPHCEVHP